MKGTNWTGILKINWISQMKMWFLILSSNKIKFPFSVIVSNDRFICKKTLVIIVDLTLC